MDPLSVRMREYIEAHPGIRKDRFIGSIVDDYHENPTDVERILQVLERTGKVYACKVYNPALQNFMSFYYPIDAVPSFCEQEAL